MRPRKRTSTAVIGSVLVLLSGTASAGHDQQFTVDVSPTAAGAVADVTSSVNYGTNIGKSSTEHLPPGALLAHANDASSPVSPPPVHGDIVGKITATSDLWSDGCGNPATQVYTLKWVEPIGSGAPSGTVAEISAVANPLPGLTITKRGFFVYKSRGDSHHSGAHYDIVAPDLPDEFACSGSSASQTTLGYGFARSGTTVTSRVVGRNPSTVGTHTAYFVYVDTANATHEDSDTFTTT